MKKLSGIKTLSNTLFFKLFVWLSAILLMLAALVQLVSINLYGGMARELLEDNYSQIFGNVERSMLNLNEQLARMLVQFNLSAELPPALSNPMTDRYEQYRTIGMMNNYIAIYTALLDAYQIQLTFLGTNGSMYTSNTHMSPVAYTTLMADPLVQKAASNNKSIVYAVGKDTAAFVEAGQPSFLLAQGLFKPYRNTLNGVAVVGVEEETLFRCYREFAGETVRFSLVAPDGSIVSDSLRDQVGLWDEDLLAAGKQACNQTGYGKYNGKTYWIRATKLTFLDSILIELVDMEVISSRTKQVWLQLIWAACGFLLLAAALTFYVVNRITKPVLLLSQKMEQYPHVQSNERLTLSGCYEVEVAGNAYNKMLDEIDRFFQRLLEENQARRQAELSSLQMQIEPHFLYNTLASVRYLVMYGRKQQAADSLSALIALLQKTFGDKREFITLAEELQMVEHYMTIQKYRYGEQIRLSTNIEPQLGELYLPKLILQPLVENSIFHGFGDETPHGQISIFARQENSYLIIEILDNGKGFSIENEKKNDGKRHGIGTRNVDERLKLIYGKDYGLQIISTPNVGTQVIVRLQANTQPPN